MTALDSGPRVLGKYERLCRERQARDFALAYGDDPPRNLRQTRHPKGYWFDPDAADRVVEFIEGYCHHHKGEWAGQPLLLEDWQKDDLLRPIFGWRRADGTRRFRTAYIEIARKQGKSEIAAAVGLYLTVADDEPGAEIYASATKRDQAKIVHDTATAMVKASPELRRFVKTFRNNIHVPRLGSKFEPLGADSNTMDGLNPHGNLVDELHAHRDRSVWDVMDTAMGARRQPLTFAITTAGVYEPESIGWQMHDHATKVLEGALEDDAFFAFIAAADEGDDWTDPVTWGKANPNLGVSMTEEYLAEQCAKAKAQPSFLNTFLRLHLDTWTSQLDRWISMEAWNASDVTLTRAQTLEREQGWARKACYGGLDLASKLDIAALVLAFPLPEHVYGLLYRFWVPEARIVERSHRDRVPYDAWVRDGWMTATPGDVIDYDFIETEIKALAQTYALKELAFDPWNATQTATHLTDAGIIMVETRQGYRTLSEPSKEFEKLVVARQLRHGGHPVMRWMVSNVATRQDPNGNIAPDKDASAEKIDGVLGAIMALSRAIVQPEPSSGWLLMTINPED